MGFNFLHCGFDWNQVYKTVFKQNFDEITNIPNQKNNKEKQKTIGYFINNYYRFFKCEIGLFKCEIGLCIEWTVLIKC